MEDSKPNQVYKKTLKFGTSILFLFAVVGFTSAYIGKLIDERFGTYPFGYIVMMVGSYVLSILLSLHLAKKFNVINLKKNA